MKQFSFRKIVPTATMAGWQVSTKLCNVNWPGLLWFWMLLIEFVFICSYLLDTNYTKACYTLWFLCACFHFGSLFHFFVFFLIQKNEVICFASIKLNFVLHYITKTHIFFKITTLSIVHIICNKPYSLNYNNNICRKCL